MNRVISMQILLATTIALLISCGSDGEALQEDVVIEEGQLTEIQQNETESTEDTEPSLPGVMGAKHILIAYSGSGVAGILRSRADAEVLAGNIRARIINEEMSFEEAAMRYSDCSSADSGGILPDFREGAMVPSFETAVKALEPGDISGIVETNFGFHIIERTK